MRRRKRMLVMLSPLLLGLAYYNYTFFKERSERFSGSSVSSPQPTAARASTPTVGQQAAEPPSGRIVADRSPPVSYEEALVRLRPRVLSPTIIATASWATRDIFTHRSVTAATVDAASVPIGGPSPARVASEGAGLTETIPVPLRFDGWVLTPDNEYAIINGSLAKGGSRLPTDERVLTVSRRGVVVSTGQGVQTLPFVGEESDPSLKSTTRSVR